MAVLACNRCLVKAFQGNQSPCSRRGNGGSGEAIFVQDHSTGSREPGATPASGTKSRMLPTTCVFSEAHRPRSPLEGTDVPFEGLQELILLTVSQTKLGIFCDPTRTSHGQGHRGVGATSVSVSAHRSETPWSPPCCYIGMEEQPRCVNEVGHP